MATVIENLDLLKNNIQTAKDTIATNLTAKGVQVTGNDTLTILGSKIVDIPTGGGGNPFTEFGYDGTPTFINDEITKAKELQKNWDSSITDISEKFLEYYDSFFPKLDLSNVTRANNVFNGGTWHNDYLLYAEMDLPSCTSLYRCFQNCYQLREVKFSNTNKVTSFGGCFKECSKLRKVTGMDLSSCTSLASCFSNARIQYVEFINIPNHAINMEYCFYSSSLKNFDFQLFNFSKITSLESTFNRCSLTSVPSLDLSSCTSLRECFLWNEPLTTIGKLITPKVTNFTDMIDICKILERVEELDFSSATQGNVGGTIQYPLPKLYFLLIKNLGKTECAEYKFDGLPSWGDNSKGADSKQSLIDTLITYSFDRTANGKGAVNIVLNPATMGFLTEDEKAQIAAKGFTLVEAVA